MNFEPNLELDARMVLVAMQGGITGLMAWAFMHPDKFPETSHVTGRAAWLKTQPMEYIEQVSNRVVELEDLPPTAL